eukprot:gene5652-6837_t
MTSPDLSAVSTATTIAQRVIKDSTPAILRTLDNLDPRGVHLPGDNMPDILNDGARYRLPCKVGQIHHRYYRAYLAARAKRLEDEKDRIESQDSAYRARFKRKRLQMELDEAKRVAALAVEQQDAAVQEVARLRREKQAALSGTGAAVEAVQEQLKHGGFGTQVKYAEASMEECVEQVKGMHWQAADTMEHPLEPVLARVLFWVLLELLSGVLLGLLFWVLSCLAANKAWLTLLACTTDLRHKQVRGLVPDQYLPAVLEDPMTCGEAAELHRDRVIQHLTEYTIWQSEWRGEKVAVHVLKDEFADAAMLRRTRKTASVLRTLRERGASGVITMYAECAGTFVTELLPYTLPEVLRGSELLPPPLPNGSTPWLKWGGERCDAVCGRLQLTPDQEPWCGARPVMPLDEIVRLGAALDAARALEVVHNTTMPAGGTLVHFQLGSGAFKVNARGRLKLGGFDEARMLRGHMYQDASNSGHFCEGPEGPAGPAPETRRGTLQSASYMDAKVDMFGFGDVLYELLGEPRAWRFKNAAQIARKGVRHPDPEGCVLAGGGAS